MGLTPQLYDAGEEQWKLKIHAGCGNIYLESYWNIDLAGYLAKDHPAETLLNTTDVRDYYARLTATFPELPVRRPTYVDEFADMARLHYPLNSIDKILAVQVFEHLTPLRAINCLTSWWGMLRKDGIVTLSVPEMRGTIGLLGNDETRMFAIRHLLGSARDQFNYHQSWYTAESLQELLESIGFGVERLDNFHLYPSLVFKCHK